MPSLPKMAARWGWEIGKWLSAGRPRRTDEEVESLLAICQGCDKLVDNRCAVCGCRVTKSKVAIVNKLRMATTACPRGRW